MWNWRPPKGNSRHAERKQTESGDPKAVQSKAMVQRDASALASGASNPHFGIFTTTEVPPVMPRYWTHHDTQASTCR